MKLKKKKKAPRTPTSTDLSPHLLQQCTLEYLYINYVEDYLLLVELLLCGQNFVFICDGGLLLIDSELEASACLLP